MWYFAMGKHCQLCQSYPGVNLSVLTDKDFCFHLPTIWSESVRAHIRPATSSDLRCHKLLTIRKLFCLSSVKMTKQNFGFTCLRLSIFFCKWHIFTIPYIVRSCTLLTFSSRMLINLISLRCHSVLINMWCIYSTSGSILIILCKYPPLYLRGD